MMALLFSLFLVVLEWGFIMWTCISFVSESIYTTIFNYEFNTTIFNNTTTMQCIITFFVVCITLLQLSKGFFSSGPAMRVKVLECTLGLVAEIDMGCFMSDTWNEDTLVDAIKAKWEDILQSDGMDDKTKDAVKKEFMTYAEWVYCLKKDHGSFVFGSEWETWPRSRIFQSG
jgi:hypothetical protein